MSTSKKTKFQPRNRAFLITLAAISVLAIGAITVVSRQASAAKSLKALSSRPSETMASVKVAGQDPQLQTQTQQVRPLTPDEAQQLAQELKSRLNRSTDGLTEQRHEDGSVSMDLQGRFQSVVVVRRNDDGSVTESCVDNPKSAASFFGIDPKLVGVQSPGGVNKAPVRSAPVKN